MLFYLSEFYFGAIDIVLCSIRLGLGFCCSALISAEQSIFCCIICGAATDNEDPIDSIRERSSFDKKLLGNVNAGELSNA